MKLPFDLGVKLFFRLLLPGFFLALAVLPVLFGLLDVFGLGQQREVALVMTTVVLGWLLIAADNPIYMLLEGRRYWPSFLRNWFLATERRRLERLNGRINEYYVMDGQGDAEVKRRYLEASVAKRSFPLDAEGERYSELPTRLGNTITAFETYSMTRYGLDAIFYWPRIWVNLGKDLREELDNQQAIADSTVYCAFALGLVAVLWVAYGVVTQLQNSVSFLLHPIGLAPLAEAVSSYLPSAPMSFLIAGCSLVLSFVIYLLAIFANEQFGNVFMSVIDANVSKVRSTYVDAEGIRRKLTALTGSHVDDGDELEAVRRYLQYYNARLAGQPRAVPIPQIKKAIVKELDDSDCRPMDG